jgi:hypothetical protein
VKAAVRPDARHPSQSHELASSALGDDTAGAVDVAICRAVGITADRVKWLLGSGRWQSPFPRVYVVFNGPIPLITMQHAALLYAGEARP